MIPPIESPPWGGGAAHAAEGLHTKVQCFCVCRPRGGARGLMMTALSKQMPWLEDRVVSASGLPALRRRGPVSSGSIRFDTVFIISRGVWGGTGAAS